MQDETVIPALALFAIPGTLKGVHSFKVGHINETFISTWNDKGHIVRYLHQKVNSFVFKNVPAVMGNIERVITHLKSRTGNEAQKTLTIVPTKDGRSFGQDVDGGYWRTYEFLENTISFEVCTDKRQAYEAAKVLGKFLAALSDCKVSDYHETIKGFQNVPGRFLDLDQAIKNDSEGRVREVGSEIEFALIRAERASIVETLLKNGSIPLRITHSDPKFNNVLFESLSGGQFGPGVAVVDLDTVMPGTMIYDFGDLARSVVVAAREDETDLSKVTMNESLYEELVRGYLGSASAMLKREEVNLMSYAPRLIALSLGVRFLTDYLNGDKYFKIHRLMHNLERSRTQFKIVLEMERAEDRMRTIVDRIYKSSMA